MGVGDGVAVGDEEGVLVGVGDCIAVGRSVAVEVVGGSASALVLVGVT